MSDQSENKTLNEEDLPPSYDQAINSENPIVTQPSAVGYNRFTNQTDSVPVSQQNFVSNDPLSDRSKCGDLCVICGSLICIDICLRCCIQGVFVMCLTGCCQGFH